MYCVSCGVKLGSGEKKCPLCGVLVYHPDLKQPEGERLFPVNQEPDKEVSPWGIKVIILTVFLLPLITVLMCDLSINRRITWSGFVIGGLILLYAVAVLPYWFKNHNPVIFVPIDFALVCCYLLYINFAVNGRWFMTFAFPITGFFGLLVTAIVTLHRYIRRGSLYIFGGATVLTGLFMPIMELLFAITFDDIGFIGWSFYPLGALALLGGFLIFLGICRPAREMMERKFFL